MAQLAIKGHSTRGSEVIALLEMLGGINEDEHKCYISSAYYFIKDNYIDWCHECTPESEFICFSLEEFLEKYPYKVGDKVIVDKNVEIINRMRWDGNEIVYGFFTTHNLGELTVSIIQPYKEETMEDKSNLLQQLKEYFDNTPREVVEKEWHEYDKYNEIGPKVNEYLEYVNNIRQPKYPKTYEECHELMVRWKGCDCNPNSELILCGVPIHDFCKLLVARNIYWKIAGEQMGWGKPWEQNYCDRCFIIANNKGNIHTYEYHGDNNVILAFPTAEMRDAFYENFKELIEQCKEFL